MRTLLLFVLAAGGALAQPLSLGVKAGVPLNNAFKIADASTYLSDRQPYVIGPMAELHLPFRLSVEFDALYRRVKYSSESVSGSEPSVPLGTSMTTKGRSFEFPLLLKYRVSEGIVRPYLGAGLVWRSIGGLKQTFLPAGGTGLTETDEPAELRDSSGGGVVFSGGLELRVPFLRVSPELRYTRWGTTSFRTAVGDFRSQVNQAEFLIGITF